MCVILSKFCDVLLLVQDLEYLREAFSIGKSEEEAASFFRSLIDESLSGGWSTQLNWWIHLVAHRK